MLPVDSGLYLTNKMAYKHTVYCNLHLKKLTDVRNVNTLNSEESFAHPLLLYI